MYEEEIGGDRHTDLLIRFAEACGTTRERVMDPDNMSATTRGLQSWCYAVAMREDPIVAVAGLVVGLESQVPSIYRRQTPTLREKYGFTDEEVEFFDLHIVSDEIHGERGYQIVLEHATTVELQQRCLKICEIGAQMRLLYTTALYYDYVAPNGAREGLVGTCAARPAITRCCRLDPPRVAEPCPTAGEEFRNHIARRMGRGRASGTTFDNVNPADTRDIVGRFQASTTKTRWRRSTPPPPPSPAGAPRRSPSAPRCCWTRPTTLEANASGFAAELTREEGKPLSLAKDEFMRSAQTLRFYAVEGQTFTGETFPQDDPDMLVYTSASRWAWSPSSRRGTSRCRFPRARSRRP